MHPRSLTVLIHRTGNVFQKSYYEILFAGAVSARLKASMVIPPDLITPAHPIEDCQTMHISSFILLLLLCENKSILGD